MAKVMRHVFKFIAAVVSLFGVELNKRDLFGIISHSIIHECRDIVMGVIVT